MSKSSTAKTIVRTRFRNTLVLGTLITCLLLSSCAVRKSIEVLLSGSAGIELKTEPGFKKINTAKLLTNSNHCPTSELRVFDTAIFSYSEGQNSVLPRALFFVTLFSVTALSLRALYLSNHSTLVPKVSFAFSEAPIYLKNRLLLI